MKQVTRSWIKGPFDGWKLGAVFELNNGQFWEQAEATTRPKRLSHPRAVVWREKSKYYLEVPGMREMVVVRRCDGPEDAIVGAPVRLPG